MASGPSPWRRVGLLHLPAVPPWEDALILAEGIALQPGDCIRVRIEWNGTEGGYLVELAIITGSGIPFADP